MGLTSYGNPRLRNWCAVSSRCAPQSPNAPMPKSNQQRHCPFTKSLLYECPCEVVCQISQSSVAGTGCAAGNEEILVSQPCQRRAEFMCAVTAVTSLIMPASI